LTSEFDLDRFLPYMLNQTAEAVSRSFQEHYRDEFDLSRTQWRVIAHLGKSDGLTAKEICQRSHDEKTTVSRAVASLEDRGLLTRTATEKDRRSETLSLTATGKVIFDELGRRAAEFDKAMRSWLGPEASNGLEATLKKLMGTQRP
jgi:DNA-binding MarR family transcriptional regulator